MRIPEVDRASISLLDGDTVLLTTPARTAVDVARLHGAHHGAVAMDSFLHQFDPGARAELEATVRRLAREKGIAHARTALAWSSSLSQSPYESLLRVVLQEEGITAQQQMWIGPYVRTDLLIGQVVVEVDGAHCVQQIRELVALSARLGPPKVPDTAARPAHGEDWRTRAG